jgi:hypothetical protein
VSSVAEVILPAQMSVSAFAGRLSAAFSCEDAVRARTFRQILALKNVRISLNNSASCEICPLMGLNQHIFEVLDVDGKVMHSICLHCLKLLKDQCQDEVLLRLIEDAFKQSRECSALIARIDKKIEADRKKRCDAVTRDYEELKEDFENMVAGLKMNEKHRERLRKKINDVLRKRMMTRTERAQWSH